MNVIHIAGHLGADPETRFTPSGQKVTNFRLATNIRRGGKDETIWYKIVVWGDRFDKMMAYLKKGTGIIVIGEMGKPEIYTDREGRPQISLEITAEIIRFSPFGKPGSQEQGQSASASQPRQNYAAAPAQAASQGGFAESSFVGAYGTAAHANQESEEEMPF